MAHALAYTAPRLTESPNLFHAGREFRSFHEIRPRGASASEGGILSTTRRNAVKEEYLREVCSLPAQFPTSGLSWVELVQRSPWGSVQSRPTEEQLAEFLRSNQELVELWLAWSEDQRSMPSQFFRQSGPRYEVGHIDSGGRSQSSELFDESALACAHFMLRELDV
jgi:hypothetical protein